MFPFDPPTLERTPERALRLVRRITEPQQRRLHWMAERAGHTAATIRRALRLWGYFDASDIWQPDYDAVVGRLATPECAQRMKLAKLFDGERPYAIHAKSRASFGAAQATSQMQTDTLARKVVWYADAMRRAHLLGEESCDLLAADASAVALELAFRAEHATAPAIAA
ncbi:MAG: hypothetical protein AAGG50_13345 [Bacteroidota bacterium]